MTTFHVCIFVVPCAHLVKIRNKTGRIRLARVWTRPSAPCVCRGDKGAQWIIHTKLLFITVFFPKWAFDPMLSKRLVGEWSVGSALPKCWRISRLFQVVPIDLQWKRKEWGWGGHITKNSFNWYVSLREQNDLWTWWRQPHYIFFPWDQWFMHI